MNLLLSIEQNRSLHNDSGELLKRTNLADGQELIISATDLMYSSANLPMSPAAPMVMSEVSFSVLLSETSAAVFI